MLVLNSHPCAVLPHHPEKPLDAIVHLRNIRRPVQNPICRCPILIRGLRGHVSIGLQQLIGGFVIEPSAVPYLLYLCFCSRLLFASPQPSGKSTSGASSPAPSQLSPVSSPYVRFIRPRPGCHSHRSTHRSIIGGKHAAKEQEDRGRGKHQSGYRCLGCSYARGG